MRTGDRPLRSEERALIDHLLASCASGTALPAGVRVVDMDDGGMGSLSFVSGKPRRAFGRIAGCCGFLDADGVLVDAALLLDKEGDLLQLDLWKVDFPPLLRIPHSSLFSPPRGSANNR